MDFLPKIFIKRVDLCKVDPNDVGQAITVVDTPGEDAVGETPSGWDEDLRNEAAGNGSTDGLTCSISKVGIRSKSTSHKYPVI